MFDYDELFLDVAIKIKKKNQILFSRESKCLYNLRSLICEQKHLTLVLWVFDCLGIPLSELMLRHPEEIDIQKAYDLCLLWAEGKIKMPIARRSILDCHAVAKRLNNPYDIALCHAIGQGCATVHVETHALGLVFYELTAIVIKQGYSNYEIDLMTKINYYEERLRWWQNNIQRYETEKTWADFLVRPGKINREKMLVLKQD